MGAIRLDTKRTYSAEVGRTVSLANRRVRKLFLRVSDVVKMVHAGAIKGYKHNRGGKELSPAHIYRIASQFEVEALSTIHLEDLEDGRYEIVDGHNRLRALCSPEVAARLIKSGDPEIEFTVCASDIALRLYTLLNVAKNHTLADALGNPDFAPGKYITKFLRDNSLKMSKGKSHIVQLAIVFHALTHGIPRYKKSGLPMGKELTWKMVYGYKTAVDKQATMISGAQVYSLMPSQETRAVNAFKYIEEFYKELTASKGDPTLMKQFVSNSGLWGFLFFDFITGSYNVCLSHTPKELARKFAKNANAKFTRSIKNLCRYSDNSADDLVAALR